MNTLLSHFKIKKYFLILFLSLFILNPASKANTNAEVEFKEGSYIIDMGVQPQTYKNGLAPYGLIYDLVINNEIPVYWIIKSGKPLFGTDFTYNGSIGKVAFTKEYKGSALIIPAIYINSDVEDTIAAWRLHGITIDGPVDTDFDAPVYNYITSFPNAILDSENAKLVTDMFYDYTVSGTRGIPTNYYTTGTPGNITTCSDVYALPHADPQKWTAAEIQTYKDFISISNGFLWQGCHSVSAVEAHDGASISTALLFDTDLTIEVKDGKGFEIADDFTDINITTHVTIIAKKFKLGKNVTFNIFPGGELEIHTKESIEYGQGSSINNLGGSFAFDLTGDQSGDGHDDDLTSPTTISKDKQFNKVKLATVADGDTADFLNMFLLTTNGQIAWDKDIDYDFDNKNSPDFKHEPGKGDNPIMQIASRVSSSSGAAQTDGSQKIYIPRPDSAWRSTTTVAVWDDSNVNNTLNSNNSNKAALIAFGRAYGVTANGILVQQASHTSKTGDESQNVAAAKFYGNLLLQSSIEKRPLVTIGGATRFEYPNSYDLNATVKRGAGPYDFAWSMKCDGNDSGTFSPATQDDVNMSNVIYTPDNTTLEGCILRVKVTDTCNRKNFAIISAGISGYSTTIGYINITHANEDFSGAGGIDSRTSKDPINSLYTQASGQTFGVTIVNLDEDKETPKARDGNIILEIVEASLITSNDPASCSNANSYSNVTATIARNANGSHFNNTTSIYDNNITYSSSQKNAAFRVSSYELALLSGDTYNFGIPTSSSSADLDARFPDCHTECLSNTDWGCYECIAKEYGDTYCSRDNFSIRPAGFAFDLNESAPFIGGRKYELAIKAVSVDLNISTGYTQTIDQTTDKNVSTELIIPTGCAIIPQGPDAIPDDINFTNGVGTTALYSYDNVGDINMTAVDSSWSLVDVDKNNSGTLYSDCIEGSGDNTLVSGKIGCSVTTGKTFEFKPLAFRNALNITNYNGTTFTYISDCNSTTVDCNTTHPAANLNFTYTAVIDDTTPLTLEDNSAATNYIGDCYSKDINTTITLLNDRTLDWNTTQGRIWFYDKNTTDYNNSQIAIFTHSQALFDPSTPGEATPEVVFNFDRNLTRADNPFQVFKNDFNVTVIENTSTGITGSDFNRTVNSNATFYYGRTHTSKQRYAVPTDAPYRANIYYEVYCFNTASPTTCTPLLLPSSQRTDDIRWFVNTNHNAASGNAGTVIEKDGLLHVTGSATTGGTIQDFSNLTYNHTSGNNYYPYKTTMENNASHWLIYNEDNPTATRNKFQVEFDNANSGWSGEHETNTTTINPASVKTNRRSMW